MGDVTDRVLLPHTVSLVGVLVGGHRHASAADPADCAGVVRAVGRGDPPANLVPSLGAGTAVVAGNRGVGAPHFLFFFLVFFPLKVMLIGKCRVNMCEL